MAMRVQVEYGVRRAPITVAMMPINPVRPLTPSERRKVPKILNPSCECRTEPSASSGTAIAMTNITSASWMDGGVVTTLEVD